MGGGDDNEAERYVDELYAAHVMYAYECGFHLSLSLFRAVHRELGCPTTE